MGSKYLVIGITGVTCGGKTTLGKRCLAQIYHITKQSTFKVNVKVISQDDYFLDVEDKRHVWVDEIKHIHFDIITSLDMEKMYQDILTTISNKQGAGEECEVTKAVLSNYEEENGKDNPDLASFLENVRSDINILILEGFCIYEHKEMFDLCDLRYFFTLDYEECKRRRLLRVYEPPDCDGYFDICVWPEYLKYIQLVQAKSDQGGKHHVTFFESDDADHSVQVFKDIIQHFTMC